MEKNKLQLLLTFTVQNQLIATLRSILSRYIIANNKIYVFESESCRTDLFYTYNVCGFKDKKVFLPNTISVHRNKETNTFYTINALNRLIEEINNGVLDKSYRVEWTNFSNMVLHISDGRLYRTKVVLKEVCNFEKEKHLEN